MSHPEIDRRRRLFPKPIPVQEQTHASVVSESKSYTLKSLSQARSSNHEADQELQGATCGEDGKLVGVAQPLASAGPRHQQRDFTFDERGREVIHAWVI
jgi:hypothetical protein